LILIFSDGDKGYVRRLGSNLRASLVTPCSTRRKNRNGEVNFEERSMDSPDSARRFSPPSSHAIAHLRDLEDDKKNQEGCAEEVTAKQRRLRMELYDETDSESDDESVVEVSVDEEVEFEQGEYQFTSYRPFAPSTVH
jgi:hypothetical protein